MAWLYGPIGVMSGCCAGRQSAQL